MGLPQYFESFLLKAASENVKASKVCSSALAFFATIFLFLNIGKSAFLEKMMNATDFFRDPKVSPRSFFHKNLYP